MRKLLALAALLILPGWAFAQGVRVDNPGGPAQKIVQGFVSPIPGATITVCTSSATGTPCTPLVPTSPVTLCTDSTCSTAAPNPFTADAGGNYGFWAVPGTYKVSTTAPGVTGSLLTVTLPCASGVSCVSTSGNNTFTGNNTHSGTETFTGAPAITASNAGVFTNAQMNLYLQSLVNSCSPITEFQASQGNTNFDTEGITACVKGNVSDTVHQISGLAGFANTSSTNVNAVGVYGQARAVATAFNVWGGNFLTQDTVGLSGHIMQGIEVDNNIFGTPTTVYGIQVTGASTGTLPATSVGVFVRPPGTNKPWGLAAFGTQTGAATIGLNLSPVASGNNQPSQNITFGAVSAGGTGSSPTIGTNANGQITFTSAPGFSTIFSATGGSSALIQLNGSSSGQTVLTVPAMASGTATFPAASGTVGLNLNATNGLYQSKRAVAGCTTGAAAGNSCASDITVTWGTAFADANYSVTCTGSTPTNVPSAPFVVSASKLAASVHINYFAITAAAASYATIDCIAVHD